ncbi:hypothetical protein WKW80_09305 [Variovorax humicola]|uniref:HNH nuclease domain-containing protein n=1 Tax=Variovorax humicola TaxID=1769758 RepID=A0ABU8VWP5_9BURK
MSRQGPRDLVVAEDHGDSVALDVNGQYVLIDKADLGELEWWRWAAGWSLSVAYSHGVKHAILNNREMRATSQLGRLMLKAKIDDYVKHADGNTLNCRRSNLRLVPAGRDIGHSSKLAALQAPDLPSSPAGSPPADTPASDWHNPTLRKFT